MKLLITGASGFAGTHLVELYSKNTKKVEIHCATFGGPGELPRFIKKERIYEFDLLDAKKVESMIKSIQPEKVIHLAGMAAVGGSYQHPQFVLKNNILITANLLEGVRKHAKKATVLLIGSADEYGSVDPSQVPISEDTPLKPTSPYAVSKIAVDFLGFQYFLAFKIKIVRLRPFNHIGEYQTPGFVVSDFAKRIVEAEKKDKQVIKVGNLSIVRDFTDVKDMVRAYSLALTKCNPGEVYNVGSGKGVRIQDLLNIMVMKARKEIRVEVDPKLFRPVDVESIVADTTKFRTITGWKPTIPLEATIERVLNYWRKKTREENGKK